MESLQAGYELIQDWGYHKGDISTRSTDGNMISEYLTRSDTP